MDLMQILTTDLEAFTISALAMVGSLVVVALIAVWDQHAVKGAGVHVKSSKRDLLLASELVPCNPVSEKIMARDPINALYDTENSYPEYCPPVKGKKGAEATKKAA